MLAVSRLAALVPAALLLLAAGCAHYPDNPPLSSVTPDAGYRYKVARGTPASEKPFLILSFSGGGTRAAAFAFGLLEELDRTEYTPKGATGKRKLLHDVEIVSSVSGGSFTAAYYALFPERFFDKFPEAVLYRNIQGALFWRLFNPYNWYRLASADFSRIDMAAEFYDDDIFEHKTFADLLKQKQGAVPFLMLNATDIGITHRFEFTQDQFDLLCSDLAGVPVARAVAASSNFPVAFAPLTVDIPRKDCGPLPTWVGLALKEKRFDRRYSDADAAASYRRADRSFAHLLDGGLSDNLGLRGAFQAVTTTDSARSIVNSRLDTLMVIVANAKTTKRHDWDGSSTPPGVASVLDVALSGPMDDVSFDSVEMFDNQFDYMKQLSNTVEACNDRLKSCPGEQPISNPITTDFTFAELSFDRIQDEHLRRCLQELPTSFHLPGKTVDLLRVSAASLLNKSKSFIAGMQRIDPTWKPRTVEIDPELVKEVCGKAALR